MWCWRTSGALLLCVLSAVQVVHTVCGNRIFFLDVTGEHLEPYFAFRCAVESAATHNPGIPVEVYSNTIHEDTWAGSKSSVKVLPFTPRLWVKQYSQEFQKGKTYNWTRLREGFVVNHVSDALRKILLFMWGGTYLDTDVLSLRSLKQLGPQGNILSWESTLQDLKASGDAQPHINDATMVRFQPRNEILRMAIARFHSELRTHEWGWQGPKLITRTYQDAPEAVRASVRVLPPMHMSPIPWHQLDQLFARASEDEGRQVLTRLLSNQRTVLVHLFASQIAAQFPIMRADSVLFQLYHHACPRAARAHLQIAPPALPSFVAGRFMLSSIDNQEWRVIDALVQRLSVSIKHPRIGQQIMATASPDMLVSIDLEVDLADASSPHVQILQNIPSQRLRELVFSELLVCVGIASELRKCHPANSLEFGLGHRLLVGQHVLHAWIMSASTGTTSPAAQAAAVTFTADYWEWQRRRQQAWLATTRNRDLFTPTHADSTSN